MDRFFGRYSTYFYALLRIVVGFLFMIHGTQKLLGFPPAASPMQLNTMLTAAGIVELITGLLVMIGLSAGIAAFIACGEMAVAYFMVHQPIGPLPIQNGGELAVLYAFVFLYIASRGSGIWSVDSLMGRGAVRTD